MFISPANVIAKISPYVSDWTSNLTVADFGSGTGDYVLEIARQTDGNGRVYGIDIQKNLLDRLSTNAAARGYDNVMTVWSDLEELGATKIPEASIDVVLLANIMFQVEEKDALLQEVSRLLKPSGLLVVVDWQDSFNGLGPQSDSIITKQTVEQLLISAGYDIQSSQPTTDHHYLIIANKS